MSFFSYYEMNVVDQYAKEVGKKKQCMSQLMRLSDRYAPSVANLIKGFCVGDHDKITMNQTNLVNLYNYHLDIRNQYHIRVYLQCALQHRQHSGKLFYSRSSFFNLNKRHAQLAVELAQLYNDYMTDTIVSDDNLEKILAAVKDDEVVDESMVSSIIPVCSCAESRL